MIRHAQLSDLFRRTACAILGSVLSVSIASVATAQEEAPKKVTESASSDNPAVPAAGHSLHGEAFNEGPRRAAVLKPGQGEVQFPVTSASPEAQKFVNQGVGQLHSFYYFESERSFRQAAKIDPNCAMAYWGMAMSNVNNAKRANGFLAEARKAAAKAKITPRETAYLDALEKLHKTGADEKTRRNGWQDGLDQIITDYPDDLNARAWYAQAAWEGGRVNGGVGNRKAVDLVIQSVMDKQSNHPGSHHYRIHLWDGNRPIRAVKSAETYASTAPGIAHAWHMPGHTYTGLQRYPEAAYQQEGSARVDHAYMIADRVMPFEIHNYAHNNQWLATTYSHIGRVKDGLTVARDLVDQPRDPGKNHKNDGGSSQRSGRARLTELYVKYELWDDLINDVKNGLLDYSDVPAEKRMKWQALGQAAFAKNDKALLSQQIAEAKGVIDAENKKEEKARDKTLLSSAESVTNELQGYSDLLAGNVGPAFEKFAKAGMRSDRLALLHLAARNYGFAESEAKKASDQARNQYQPMAQYVEILEKIGKTDKAREAYGKLVPLARHADRDTPIAGRLAAIESAWKAAGWAPPADPDAGKPVVPGAIDLTTLGPLAWHPAPALDFELPDTENKIWRMSDRKATGRNTILIFFLGGKCAHCMQQLQSFGKEFDKFREAGDDIVAVSTDDLATSKELKNNKDGVKFPMPILSNPDLSVFKAHQAHDDFESVPLHGLFIIDAAGMVRFQRISPDPFLDVDFVKQESARVRNLVKHGR
jgi:peroxiredoxin